MNVIEAEISKTEYCNSLALIELVTATDRFSTLILNFEDNLPFVKIGNKVLMIFKETELEITPDNQKQLDKNNKFRVKIIDIKRGKIISEIKLNYYGTLLSSLMLTNCLLKYKLEPGNSAIALIRTHEIQLAAIQ